MKGIILAAGRSSRLYPATHHISKALLTVYDKPMIYYPLTALIQLGVKDILVITSVENRADFYELLRNGELLGVNIQYDVQIEKNGIADALIIGERFIGNDSVALALCDNIFLEDFSSSIEEVNRCVKDGKAMIFCDTVKDIDVHRFGILETDENFKPKSIIEKPVVTNSNIAITGLYIYPKNAARKAKKLQPSMRGEKEISDLNAKYLEEGRLEWRLLEQRDTWMDVGTPNSLLTASALVANRQICYNTLYGSPELAAAEKHQLSKTAMQRISILRRNCDYYEKLCELLSKTQGEKEDERMLELSKEYIMREALS